MQSSLKKSLYLGLAAVSFVAAAGATTANASAKAATVKSDTTMTTAATSRNVTLTGTNAVYTKPGTVKGAKVVASTVTAKKLAESNKGAANFRAYRVAVTDRGSVYYKVVSFDGAYRGYVYGGKATDKFAGGVAAYNTTKDATAPKATDTFNLTATTSKDANTLFYAQPAYAQYKIGRATVNGSVLAATDKYAGASFTFDKAVTTSREGETWYEIASTKLSNGTTTTELNGAWVKASNVKNPQADPEATNDNSIKVVYQGSNGNVVAGADKTFVTTANTKANQKYTHETNGAGLSLDKFAEANVPAGYAYKGLVPDASYFGGTARALVAQAATSKVDLYVMDGNVAVPFTTTTTSKLTLTPTQQKEYLYGATADTVPAEHLAGAFAGQKLYSAAKNADGKYDVYTVSAQDTKDANNNVKFGQNVRLVLVKGTAVDSIPSTTPSEQGNSDFLN
ncbi:S-layer protein [Secundilactobacillus mixtipabuli]|uniref:S-layer protein n=1 Tax=Secundilactobacillus mixtipabuli TaxID=1435342 RepID=A0A1Z5I8Y1_9LACO|nr:S-layer protein [Secundilactobacillus mixtipabuli]GAW98212.1 S-layer protein [Secundilactobacillus mixtipabuli]